MGEAGVRLLSSVARTHLVECRNPVADDSVTNRLQGRRRQLLRVLEAGENANGQPDLGLLDRLQCLSVAELRVQYSVKAFNHEVSSDPESLQAKYQAEEQRLYFVRGGEVPWAAIARELALALRPETDPGRLASGIKEVLVASTEEAAGATLDELGFAPLEMAPEEPLPEAPVIDDLGGEVTIGEAPLMPPGTDGQTEVPTERPAPGDRQPDTLAKETQGQPRDGQETQPPDRTSLGAEDSTKRIPRPGIATPTPPPQDLQEQLQFRPEQKEGREAHGTEERRDRPRSSRESRDTERERRTASRSQGRLRTYVSPEPLEEDREQDPNRAAERDAVQRAGVERVLKYEADQKRHPKEMAPNHPGYDIESSTDTGEVERYIEVKSLSGNWGSLGAALSDTQFERASELGDRYWLYVIERAEYPDYRIYRIQDPARKVNQFIYDDGWKALAEEDKDQPSDMATIAEEAK